MKTKIVSTKNVRGRRSVERTVQKHGRRGWSRYFLGVGSNFTKKSQNVIVVALLVL